MTCAAPRSTSPASAAKRPGVSARARKGCKDKAETRKDRSHRAAPQTWHSRQLCGLRPHLPIPILRPQDGGAHDRSHPLGHPGRRGLCPHDHGPRDQRGTTVAAGRPWPPATRPRPPPFAAIAPGLTVHDSYEALLFRSGRRRGLHPPAQRAACRLVDPPAEAGKAVLCEKTHRAPCLRRRPPVRSPTREAIRAADRRGPGCPPITRNGPKARELMRRGRGWGGCTRLPGCSPYGLDDPLQHPPLARPLAAARCATWASTPIGGFRFATGLEPRVVWAGRILEQGVDHLGLGAGARGGELRFAFHVLDAQPAQAGDGVRG